MSTPSPGPRTWQTWQEREADLAARRREPQALADLALAVREAIEAHGCDATGIANTDPFPQVTAAINARKEAGQHAGMSFTFVKPERSTTPSMLLPGAQALVVAARSYQRVAPADAAGAGPSGRIARYQWTDHYGVLKAALKAGAALLKAEGWRSRVVADDNALVDRAAAHRAGLGWWGKNTNLLLPGRGSWFVLGTLVTDAPLPVTATEPVPDGCGPCTACMPACPTGAIVEPGVLDARRCLAWLVQAPGDFPEEHREAMGDRIYGCDDCQTVCPVNRLADRAADPAPAEVGAVTTVDLVHLALSSPAEVLASHGRWYLPGRDADALRRNALVALGNTAQRADGQAPDDRVVDAVRRCLSDDNPMIVRHAQWAADRLGITR